MAHNIKPRIHFAEILFFVFMATFFMSMPVSAADPFAAAYGGFGHEKMAAAEITADGGVIAVGQTESFGASGHDIWLLKLDSVGKVEWQRAIGGSGFDRANSVHQTSDGSYIVAGVVTSDDGNKNIAVFKLFGNGTLDWQKIYGSLAPESDPVIYPTGDGFILCAQTASFGAGKTDIWVLKLDNNGNVAWQKTYGGSGFEKNPFIEPTSDGGYIMACSSDSFVTDPDNDSDILVLKLNDDGTIAWQKSYGGNKFESEPVIRQKIDGTYIIAASTQSFGAGFINILLFQISMNGDPLWQYAFGEEDTVHTLSDIRITGDGYIIAGNSILSPSDVKIVLFEFINNDTINFKKRYGNEQTGTAKASSVLQTSDGGYFIIGDRNKYSSDFLILRTEESGNQAGCALDESSDISLDDVLLNTLIPNTVSENTQVDPVVSGLSSGVSDAVSHFFCNPPSGGLQIVGTAPDQTLTDGAITTEIWAQVTGGNGDVTVQAVITPPDESGRASAATTADSVTVNLVYTLAADKYIYENYNGFDTFGFYKVTYYALDSADNIILPEVRWVNQNAAPDLFEDDDSLSQAVLTYPEFPEWTRHSLYEENDEDWIKFFGIADGKPYKIKVSNAGSDCDAIITLYDANGTELYQMNDEGTGEDENMPYWFIQDGFYYVKIHQDDNSGGSHRGYDLKIFRPNAPVVAIFDGDIRSGSPTGASIPDAAITLNDFNCADNSCILIGGHFYIKANLDPPSAYRFEVSANAHYKRHYDLIVYPDGQVWIDPDYEIYQALHLDRQPDNPSPTPSPTPTPTQNTTPPPDSTPAPPSNQNASSSLIVPVYRLYSEGLTVHLFTIDENEKSTLEPTDVWRYEGIAWSVYPNYQNGVVPVYRLYSEGLKIHLFTIDENEKNTLEQTDVWHYEGIAWYVFPNWQEGLVPIYRLYSEGLRKHLYTRDENEKNTLEKTDVWRYEGIAYYAYPANG